MQDAMPSQSGFTNYLSSKVRLELDKGRLLPIRLGLESYAKGTKSYDGWIALLLGLADFETLARLRIVAKGGTALPMFQFVSRYM